MSFSRTSGSASALTTSLLSLATTSLPVPAGATMAKKELNSKPGRPDSEIVGASANCGWRAFIGTPIRRSLPPRTSEAMVASPCKVAGTWPAATSVAAWVAPLYGTWVICTPALAANSAIAMCCGLPLPPLA